MTRKIAIVGNRSFPIDAGIGAQVVEIMQSFGPDAVFLTRGSSGFDTFIVHAAIILGRRVFKYPAVGGADNLDRDRELVADADAVLGFFDYDTMHDPRTGTAMVLEAALNAKKPTRAYTCVDGVLSWAGETDLAPET